MVDHHIQKHAIKVLAHSKTARFSDLRPKNVESNVFNYHIKQLIRDGLITHKGEEYTLTPAGRRLGISAKKETNLLKELDRAFSVSFVTVRAKDTGRLLLRRRKHQPMIGKIGFVHSTPQDGKPVIDLAEAELAEWTGIKTELGLVGSGFVTVYTHQGLESFLHFICLVGEVPKEELSVEADEYSEYMWVDPAELDYSECVPALDKVLNLIEKKNATTFFIEHVETI